MPESLNVAEIQKKFEETELRMKAAQEKIAELEREKGLGAFGIKGEADERRILRSFCSSDVKSLLNVNVASKKFAGASISDRLAVMELKKDLDIARWSAQIFNGAARDQGEMEKQNQVARVKDLLNTPIAKQLDLANRLKAFGTDVVGAGAEWIETALSSNYIEEYQLEKKVANLFTEIPMPTNPFKLNLAKNGTTARIIAENSEGTGSNSGTGSLTFDATNKLFELYNLPEELNEDSAVTFLTIGREQVIDAQMRAIETAIINGDTTAVHMDNTVAVPADDARRTFKGLRKLALANTATVSFAGAAAAATKMDAMIALMGKFSLNPRETVFLVSPQISHQVTQLPEVTTVEKFGPLATILSGYLAAYRGRPIVASEYLPENMTAAGVVGAATLGGILLVNKSRFMMGRRRPIKIRVATDPRAEFDRWQLASYQRADFQGMPQSATEKSVVYGINILIQ